MDNLDLDRFLDVHSQSFAQALAEIRAGRKTSHWMWYIFPQIKGLGQSETAKFYGIKNYEEAVYFLTHSKLGVNLITISKASLQVNGKTASQIFGYPDDLKLHSSMTLFANVKNCNSVFSEVLEKYFNGEQDQGTLQLLKGGINKK